MSHTNHKQTLRGSKIAEHHERKKYWIIKHTKYVFPCDKFLIEEIEKGWRHFWVKRGYSESIKTCKDINQNNKKQ